MFSFVIRTKNEAYKLEETLKSIKNQKIETPAEIIIVDSGSTDDTLNIAERYRCKIVRILQEEFSWGYALNVGIQRTSGDYIAVISGHCVLTHENCLEIIKEDFESYPDVDVIYGRQLGDSKDDPFEKVGYYKIYPNVGEIKYLDVEPLYETVISNACSFFRKSCWEQQQFDEKVQSCEDAKWASDLKTMNICLAYEPRIGVYHSHPLSISYIYKKSYCREFEMERLRNSKENMLFYFLKYIVKRNIVECLKQKKEFKKCHESISLVSIMKYVFCTSYAQYKASCDQSRGKVIQYVSIEPPAWLKRMRIM